MIHIFILFFYNNVIIQWGFGQKGTQNQLMPSDKKKSYQHYYDLLEYNASAGFTGYWHIII